MTSDSNAIRRAKAPEGGIQEIRVLIDRFSIEIFINDGEMVMSNAITTPILPTKLRLKPSAAVRQILISIRFKRNSLHYITYNRFRIPGKLDHPKLIKK